MAHMIDMSNNRANIAYIGATPWHQLGQSMADGASLDQWRVAAGLGYEVLRTPVLYRGIDNEVQTGEGSILMRSDNGRMLSMVTERYKIVQPAEVVEFYRDLTDQHGFKMETMGALSDGKRIWALAKVGEGFTVGKNDVIETYLLLATSYDKSMATRAQFTSVRVVCHNTLSMAVADTASAVSISHAAMFNADKIKLDMGIVTASNESLRETFTAMADRKVTNGEAVKWLAEVLFDETDDLEKLSTRKANIIRNVYDLFKGRGMGSGFETANGTAFGLLNAVTEHVDHHAARNANNRLQSAWFGQGERLKAKAYESALQLVAA